MSDDVTPVRGPIPSLPQLPPNYHGDQCMRCGSSAFQEECLQCDGGYSYHDCGEDCCTCVYPEDNVRCDWCDGTGSFFICLAEAEWCFAHPLPGRESVPRGQTEPVYSNG